MFIYYFYSSAICVFISFPTTLSLQHSSAMTILNVGEVRVERIRGEERERERGGEGRGEGRREERRGEEERKGEVHLSVLLFLIVGTMFTLVCGV